MHEPLSRDMQIRFGKNSTLALVGACAAVVILTVVLVGVAVIAGELTIRGPEQAVVATKQTTMQGTGAHDAAPSSNDLFSGMPWP